MKDSVTYPNERPLETPPKEGTTVLEKCPFFMIGHYGYCLSKGHPYIPSLAEREQYCLNEKFNQCVSFPIRLTQG